MTTPKDRFGILPIGKSEIVDEARDQISTFLDHAHETISRIDASIRAVETLLGNTTTPVDAIRELKADIALLKNGNERHMGLAEAREIASRMSEMLQLTKDDLAPRLSQANDLSE